MSRQRRNSIKSARRAGWIGLGALLVIGIVVVVAYRALEGLPFQRHYHVTVQLRDAQRLIKADEVKVNGIRVGQVSSVAARRGPAGGAIAQVKIALEPSAGPLPSDTAVHVRAASPLGATYVDLDPGRSARTIPDGGTLGALGRPASGELTDLYRVFDRSTARNIQLTLTELGGGLTGRGQALNETIGALNALLPPLQRFATTLSAPSTQLGRFVRTYAALTDAVAPVSPQLRGIMANGARTFGAMAAQRRSLGAALGLAPGSEREATRALHAVRPGLDRLARLSVALRPVSRRLPAAVGTFNATVSAGTPALQQVPELKAPLLGALHAVRATSAIPSTAGALEKVTSLLDATSGVLDALQPAQEQCNVIALFFQQFAAYAGVFGVGEGPSMLYATVDRPGAQTDGIQSAEPASDLHVNYLPNENRSECEADNEPYDATGRGLANPAGLQSATTRETTPPPHVLELAKSAGLLAPKGKGQ